MSLWRDSSEDATGVDQAVALVGGTYHYVALLVLMIFVIWNRGRFWGRFVVDGTVLFPGNDPWYHYRSTRYVVEYFPQNMPFDPWTFFSFGTSNSQFGTVFDQTMATVAMIVGLGNPSDHIVRLVMIFTPVVLAAMVLVPVYVIGRRLGGRLAGVMAASIVALSSGQLLLRSVAGFADHHVVESLLMTVGVLGMMAAVSVAETEKPIYELVTDRNHDALRRPLVWGILGGFAVGLYLWAWPPGIFLLGILGVFFLVHLSMEFVRGNSPEPVAFAGVVTMATVAVMNIATLSDLKFAATSNSLLQPTLALGVAVWCIFMAYLARQWEARDFATWTYPATAVGVVLLGLGVTAVALPGFFDSITTQTARVIGFWVPTVDTAGTVGEVSQIDDLTLLFDWHGFALPLAAAGVAIVLVRQYLDDEPSGQELLAVLWFAFTLSAALTQVRFDYYAVVSMAALSAVPIGLTYRYVRSMGDGTTIEIYQVMVVVIVLMLVVAPMFVLGSPLGAAEQRGAAGPGPAIEGWEDSLSWMDQNTPLEGQYGEPDGDPMELYGTFDEQRDYDYPAGAFGVASWWDYGHWITALGNRIPNANPFQLGATEMAEYLLAQNESAASDALAQMEEDDAKTRYTMVDWKMVETFGQPIGGKFSAPTVFHPNVLLTQFADLIATGDRNQLGIIYHHTQMYYQTMAVRLYRFHGSAGEPRPLVMDWEMSEREVDINGNGTSRTYKLPPADGQIIRRFDNMSEAREFVREDGTSQIGGIGPYPSERVPALEHYRLVQQSSQSALSSRSNYAPGLLNTIQGSGYLDYLRQNPQYQNATDRQLESLALQQLTATQPAWTKVFERVPGATVEGTGPPDTNVSASVTMRTATNDTFTYRQHARTDGDGSFTMTLPYSTTGYDNWGPEQGRTNVSVRADGPYTITTPQSQVNSSTFVWHQATLNVTEAAVIGEDPDPISVELERTERTIEVGSGDGSDSGSDGSGDGGSDGSGDDGGTDGGNTTSGSGQQIDGPLLPPSIEQSIRVAP